MIVWKSGFDNDNYPTAANASPVIVWQDGYNDEHFKC